jgi:hypothetical protein
MEESLPVGTGEALAKTLVTSDVISVSRGFDEVIKTTRERRSAA